MSLSRQASLTKALQRMRRLPVRTSSCSARVWRTLPVLIETEKPITGIVAGASFSCGLRDGRAVCWGQLGSGSTRPATALVEVSGNVIFESLGRTQGHTVCGITPDRRLYCWGRADTGQLASVETTQCNSGRCVTAPQLLLPELRFTAVATGPAHTCAITTAGEALCCGLNGEENRLGSNQLERGAAVVSEAPLPVLTDERFTGISVGADHACALNAQGIAFCWGSNRNGQLGSGLAAPWWYPSAALGMWNVTPLPFSSISTGQHYTCGVSAVDARIFCWGRAGRAPRRGPGQLNRRVGRPRRLRVRPDVRADAARCARA
jgi:alpha-tubulin suppressor-like RCC1 family protein